MSEVLRLLISKPALYVAAALAGAVLAGAVAWLWDDYNHRGRRIAELELGAALEREAHDRERTAWVAREAQARADLEAVRAVAARRMAQADALATALAAIEAIEEEEDDQACPVHPAVDHALDRLSGAAD